MMVISPVAGAHTQPLAGQIPAAVPIMPDENTGSGMSSMGARTPRTGAHTSRSTPDLSIRWDSAGSVKPPPMLPSPIVTAFTMQIVRLNKHYTSIALANQASVRTRSPGTGLACHRSRHWQHVAGRSLESRLPRVGSLALRSPRVFPLALRPPRVGPLPLRSPRFFSLESAAPRVGSLALRSPRVGPLALRSPRPKNPSVMQIPASGPSAMQISANRPSAMQIPARTHYERAPALGRSCHWQLPPKARCATLMCAKWARRSRGSPHMGWVMRKVRAPKGRKQANGLAG